MFNYITFDVLRFKIYIDDKICIKLNKKYNSHGCVCVCVN